MNTPRLILCLMTSALILASIEDALKPQVAANGGTLSIAETEEDAIEELANAPDHWRVVLSMDGDKGNDDLNPAGLVEGRVVAFVQAPKGFAVQPNRNLHRDNARGTPAFFARLHWVVRKLRGMQLVATDIDGRGLRYRGWDWLRFDGQALFRTARASFDLVFAHDDPATDPTGTEPVVLPSPFRIVAAADAYNTIGLSGAAHGRVMRFEPGADDPTGTGTGYAITAAVDDIDIVSFDGIPHGPIPR